MGVAAAAVAAAVAATVTAAVTAASSKYAPHGVQVQVDTRTIPEPPRLGTFPFFGSILFLTAPVRRRGCDG